MVRCFFVVAILTAPAFAAGPADYAKPELLVDQRGFMRLLLSDDHAVVPIDVRPQADYDRAHLPTAKRVDTAAWKRAFGDGRDAAAWGKRIGDLGVGPGVTVVVYDRATTPTAMRVWWLLKYWGVEDVRVLDGGWNGQSSPTPAKALRERSPAKFIAKPQPERHATRDEVMRVIAGKNAVSTCLADTRSDAEVAAGAIPTSKHSDWTRYVDPKTGRLRPAAELKRLLDDTGFDPKRPAIAYCRTGGRASVVAFVMELMGGEQVANYYGSWNDWSQANKQP